VVVIVVVVVVVVVVVGSAMDGPPLGEQPEAANAAVTMTTARRIMRTR
jgi:hypothetical protein